MSKAREFRHVSVVLEPKVGDEKQQGDEVKLRSIRVIQERARVPGRWSW